MKGKLEMNTKFEINVIQKVGKVFEVDAKSLEDAKKKVKNYLSFEKNTSDSEELSEIFGVKTLLANDSITHICGAENVEVA